MSSEIKSTGKRAYRKKRRAELEQETRQRIAEAAMELHGTVGPAKTTISAVAERAGVQRATVYRHFPTEEALFGACSAHWVSLHPPPDPQAWTGEQDPDLRLRVALEDLYSWYEDTEYMLEKTTRDVAVVPALRPAMDAFGAWYEQAEEALLAGRPERGARRRRIRAAIAHAHAFNTWRSLVREQGLSPDEAVGLMAALVRSAVLEA